MWMGDVQARRLFPKASLERISKAIADSEARHSGEIRFAVESALELGPLFRGYSARDRAVEVFSNLRVWDTEANNGVLIYLLLADHDVEILGDRGIHAHLSAEGWEGICQRMESEFRRGNFEGGVLAGIAEVGARLERHFPRRGGDLNELPNQPVIL